MEGSLGEVEGVPLTLFLAPRHVSIQPTINVGTDSKQLFHANIANPGSRICLFASLGNQCRLETAVYVMAE
jgi:hypothetical protein